ncbi:unnamed protein product [Hymenolepis diminuta]|uniref:Uncharacterized protein n=1 Tax=Hymenolepis diminuta TaxID=6216 RepID=A0A564Z3B6_HYMDI|nr:unnamed protein product [Hymenolepis diminuta]VUZ44554.1 unnamed protein product [Hymenolepis diminuta]VUZ54017.1 unnamed protein product [Hymenolepis diminuta]
MIVLDLQSFSIPRQREVTRVQVYPHLIRFRLRRYDCVPRSEMFTVMQPDLNTDIHIVQHVVTPSRDNTFAVNCPESAS